MKNFHSLGRILPGFLFLALQLAGFSQTPRSGLNTIGGVSQGPVVAAPSDQLNFQTDPFTGRFGYQVSFPLAPGRHGSTPSLGLSYNSGGGYGLCGAGWDLDFGYIQRETKHGIPIRWANGVPQSAYDDTKGFTFSLNGKGASLVNVASNEYRAEIEGGFLKFLLLTNVNQWQITDTSGNKYFFGTGSTNRMSNGKSGWSSNAWTGTYRWALAHVETVLGDTTDYAYTNIGGTLYPLKLSYNGHTSGPANSHTVDLVLGVRSNITVSYVSGYRVEQSRRLDALIHKVSGQIVWSNRMSYSLSTNTYRTLLKSITRYGTNLTSSLPPLTFDYTSQSFGFQSAVNWTNVYSVPNSSSNYLHLAGSDPSVGGQYLDLMDFDGDGLPDRVFQTNNFPINVLWFQRNNGGGFDNPKAFGPLSIQNYHDSVILYQSSSNSPFWMDLSSSYTRMIDMNGDGLPDRVCDPIESLSNATNDYPFTRLMVQLNGGTNFVSTNDVAWTNVIYTNKFPSDPEESNFRAIEKTDPDLAMIDLNGDGLPDRVMTRKYGTGTNLTNYTNFFVQFNTGSGFTSTNTWNFPAYDVFDSSSIVLGYGKHLNTAYVRILDINGDGLPDRVMYPVSGGSPLPANSITNYIVEFNNGYGFEPPVVWGGVVGVASFTGSCLVGTYFPEYDITSGTANIQDHKWRMFLDVNGDGAPDRVYIQRGCAVTNLMVQINLGTNFAAPVPYGPYYSQNQYADDNNFQYSGLFSQFSSGGTQATFSRFLDFNGDGIPDHVMQAYNNGNPAPYYVVELGKGPLPDLLNSISNGIGGGVSLNYKPSTQYNNHETTNSTSRNLLPFPMQTVASISVFDGLYASNTTSFYYEGGKWDSTRREFDGFAKTIQVDPLGLTNVSYFHQAGGRDNSALGEYQDTATAIGKKGSVFRSETIGTNGQFYKLVLNKVEDADLGGGRHFAFSSQTIDLDYPGNLNAYRATAQQYFYDLSNGNLTNTINYGEVTNVVVATNGFSDVAGDTVYQSTTFATLANTDILDKPEHSTVTSDSGGTNILRESFFVYDGSNGNLTQQRDRMCSTCFVTNSFGYDSTYKNRTSATDEAGIVTSTSYEAMYQTFPLQQVTGNTLTNSFSFDPRSGSLRGAADPKGLVTTNLFDAFLRPIETDISTTPNGSPTLWISKTDYRLGMASGFSTNSVRTRKNDGIDSVNGRETWTYSDGLGRVIQVRSEAESANFRVSDTVYDQRGNLKFQSLPYLATGTNFVKASGNELGVLTEFDPIGRPIKTTASVNGAFTAGQLTGTTATSGDSGSLVGPSLIAYNDGNDPWTLIATDEETQVHKYSLDAYGRTNKVIEVTSGGNYTTRFEHNLVGDLASITDNASNRIEYAYNDLGQIVAIADPDTGVWQFQRDFAGRLRKQIDANNQTTVFNYELSLGRLSSRLIYDYQNNFAYGVTNVYDQSDDANFTVYPGQLYKVIDNQGWHKTGYDVRGRMLITARYLSKNGSTYTNRFAYDDEDRLIQDIYPNGGPTITNIYDTGGNLSQVKQVGGSNTVFYAAQGFNAMGQLTGITYGNGVATAFGYYVNSKRLQQTVTTKSGTNLQSLTYSYDRVANLTAIADSAYSTNASAALSSVIYDELHRLKSLTRPATSQTTTFSYDSIGNITVNGENAGAVYNYGSRLPHAVKSANGKNYAYDLNGNMLVRGTQRLSYDPENRLEYVVTTNTYSMFGYDAGGSRLWKQTSGTNGLQVWIGGNYEEKNGQVLFHVIANGQTVCTFDKTGTNVFAYYHPDHLHSTAIETDQTGARIQHYEYLAFGGERFKENSTAFPVSRRYTGQVLDEDTGLLFYGARYYDPVLSRFIQPDSVIADYGNPQTINRYSYVGNNPLKYVDPNGHWWKWTYNWIPDSWVNRLYPNGAGPTYMTASGQLLNGPPSTAPAMNNLSLLQEEIGGYDPKEVQAVGGALKTAADLVPTKAVFDSTYTVATGKNADTHEKVQPGDYIQAGGATAATLLPTLGMVKEVGGVAPVLKGEAGVAKSEAAAIRRGETLVGNEVTFELPAGGRTRADIVTESKGKLKIVESKNGPNAKLTPRQSQAQTAVQQGQPLIPRGANAEKAGLKPGEPVKIDDYRVDHH